MLGDEAAQKLVSQILEQLAMVTEQFQGRVIKTIGDEVMCLFPDALLAMQAARSMQETMNRSSFPEKSRLGAINLYVGFHAGPVIEEADDIFGDAVIVAARMVEMAKPRQILTTQNTVDVLPPEQSTCATCVDTTNIRGKSGEVKVYEIIWEQHDQTIMVDSLIDSQTFKLRMELRLGHKVVEVSADRPAITIGRQLHNDLVLDDSRVSRTHARVEYRRGKFFLVDESSNGTYILPQGGKSHKLRRDETPIIGHGVICLGRTPDPSSPDAIHFMIKA